MYLLTQLTLSAGRIDAVLSGWQHPPSSTLQYGTHCQRRSRHHNLSVSGLSTQRGLPDETTPLQASSHGDKEASTSLA